MIEFGHFALILGLAFALIQVLIPSLGLVSKNYSLVNIARPLVWAIIPIFPKMKEDKKVKEKDFSKKSAGRFLKTEKKVDTSRTRWLKG